MNISAHKIGIYNVFLADSDLKTALGGDSERRLYDTKVPQNPTFPYAQFFYTGGSIAMTFSTIIELTTWQFSIFHQSEDPLDSTIIDDVFVKVGAAYDDAEATMTISGYSVTWVTRGASGAIPTEDLTQQYFINYEIRTEKAR